MNNQDTIAAVASGVGGAVALIRVSGPQAVALGDRLFKSHSGRPLAESKGFTLHYGSIMDGNRTVDDVLVSLFRAPRSYTGEEMIEISCHASPYICREILRLLTDGGARSAHPGEFTLRAFLAGKMDLSQAEAVADLIATENRASHTLATRQMRGGYSDEFAHLRAELLRLVSLLELELDFSEEDVEFADRTQLSALLDTIGEHIDRLLDSFTLGNALKNGVPVAIVGAPNVGKSTLLNALLGEDKALVSDIAGTTRDVIEDTITIDGVAFRFIDTAGIRQTSDPLETMGIERTYDRIGKASVVLLLADARTDSREIAARHTELTLRPDQHIAVILNKCDMYTTEDPLEAKRHTTAVSNTEAASCQSSASTCNTSFQEPQAAAIGSEGTKHCAPPTLSSGIRQSENDNEVKRRETSLATGCPVLMLSAKKRIGMDRLKSFLRSTVDTGALDSGSVVIFNSRHREALTAARHALNLARTGLSDALPGDLLAQDIREVLHYIGTITGEITTDQVLSEIFSKFCVGK